jgi:hypothetical protein
MGISQVPAPSAASKTMFRTTLTSGVSYTVPAGVTYLNVTLVGGGGGAGGVDNNKDAGNPDAIPGQTISSTLSVTAGASISYAIGAGGTGGAGFPVASGTDGGTTTFTGATSATGGSGGKAGTTGPAGSISFANNAGRVAYAAGGSRTGGDGGSGFIIVEYWV